MKQKVFFAKIVVVQCENDAKHYLTDKNRSLESLSFGNVGLVAAHQALKQVRCRSYLCVRNYVQNEL